jgi:paraquat-inducible protein A
MTLPTARAEGLILCETCGLVCDPGDRPDPHCPRCGAALHVRKVDSIKRTWALLIAAAILYVPANLLPVMVTYTLFNTSRDTIMSGIVYFWKSGSPDLAILIFAVSIFIPLAKILCMVLLLVAAQYGVDRGLRQRALMFRVIEFVGRWSMLDIFVITMTVGMVRFRSLATIDAGPGAAAFGAVVVLTMIAAHTFDPRLIWDRSEKKS